MPSKINENGYMIMAGDRAVGKMRSNHGYGVLGIRHCYCKPEGYVPAPTDDKSKGFITGSEIITVDGIFYKCLNGKEGEAKWLRITGSEPVKQPQKEEKPAPKQVKPSPSEASHPEDEDLLQVDTSPPQDEPSTKQVRSIPEDMPFYGFLSKDYFLGDILKAFSTDTLIDLKYVNEDRAKKISDWLQENMDELTS